MLFLILAVGVSLGVEGGVTMYVAAGIRCIFGVAGSFVISMYWEFH